MNFRRALAGVGAAALLGAAIAGVYLWNRTKIARNQVAPPKPRSAEARLHKVAMLTNWQVKYEDAELGEVEGRAMVDWEQKRAVVRLKDPSGSTKRETILTANDVEIDKTGTSVTMRLRGESPFAARVKAPSTQGMRRVSVSEGEQFTVSPSEPSFATPIMDKALADADGLRLSLHARNFGALTGEWSYRADPITKRNTSGTGRSGYFRLLNEDELEDPHAGFIGEQSGAEEWWPLPTEIACSAVLEDQLASKLALAEYPYPYSGRPTIDADKQKTRTLFVVGRNFPVDQGRVLQDILPIGDNDESYRVIAVSTDPGIGAHKDLWYADAWNKVLQSLDEKTKQLARNSLDAAVIEVRLKENVLPGPKQFTWGGASGEWFLQFGDNLAEARFVRPIRLKTTQDKSGKDEFERTPEVFLPETLAVEIETRTVLPLASIPVRIASKSFLDRPLTMAADRVADRGNLYRTKLFPISNGGPAGPAVLASGGIGLRPGDELLATVQVDDVAFIAPPVAQATVLLTPDQSAHDTNKPASATASANVKLWKEALVLAARADNVTVDNFGTLAGHKLPPYRGISMTIGSHAAMLLLRSEFLSMLEEQLQYFDNIKSDDEVEAFREWLRPFLANNTSAIAAEDPPVGWEKYPDYLQTIEDINALREFLSSLPLNVAKKGIEKLKGHEKAGFGKGTYFGELEVPAPGGWGTWEYFTTYWKDTDLAFEPFFHHNRAQLRNWRLAATRAVLAHYREAVASTITRVRDIPDSNVKELLKLTGIGFGPVVARVLPQLMRLDDSTAAPRWVPDLPARAAVGSLYILASAARAAEDYSSLKDRALIEIVSAALLARHIYAALANLEVTALTRVAGWGLLAWQGGEEIYDQAVVRNDLDLYFGASAVLGVDRLEETNARKLTIGDVVEQLATQFAVDTVWGEIKEGTAPVTPPLPAPNQGRLLPNLPFATVYAAERPVAASPHRIRSFASRILRELGAISTEQVVAKFRGLSLETLKQWPKKQLQWFLQLAGRGGTRIELGEVANREQVRAAFEARRLKREAGHLGDPDAETVIAYGDLPPDARPPAVGQGGMADLQGHPQVQKRPVAQRPSAVALERDLPRTGSPPNDDSWIPIKEANGTTTYYKSAKVGQKGEALQLGSGASSDVYVIANVDNRSREILRGDGAVLKILKDSPDFGTARQQILRIKEAYELLKGAGIEFAEILEFHEDAEKPYLIQRRINFDGTEYKEIRVDDLFDLTRTFDTPFGKFAFLLSMDKINEKFPRELRKTVPELHFALAEHRLIAWDLSLKNIYFRKVGGKWVAGILDIDHIVHCKRPPGKGQDHVTWDQIKNIRDELEQKAPSFAVQGRQLKTTFDFMEASLELMLGGNKGHAWIQYDAEQGRTIPELIEPELVEEVLQAYRNRLRLRETKKKSCLQPFRPWLQVPADPAA